MSGAFGPISLLAQVQSPLPAGFFHFQTDDLDPVAQFNMRACIDSPPEAQPCGCTGAMDNSMLVGATGTTQNEVHFDMTPCALSDAASPVPVLITNNRLTRFALIGGVFGVDTILSGGTDVFDVYDASVKASSLFIDNPDVITVVNSAVTA